MQTEVAQCSSSVRAIRATGWRCAGYVPPKGSRKGHNEVCDPRQGGFSELACKAKFPDAYAITYWMHSW